MWDKLKREWKTFSLAVVSSAIGIWDVVSTAGYDLTPIIPEQDRPYVVPAIGISFLLLRKWKDATMTTTTVETKTETVTEPIKKEADVSDK